MSYVVVTLEVRESWKGLDAATVEVATNSGGGSCGFNFKVGHRYLVFATRGGADGRLSVSMCSRTREYGGSSEDIAFLASLSLPETGGRVFGTTEVSQTSFKGETGAQPLDLNVRLTGNGRTLSSRSSQGRYEFAGLQPGQYEVSVDFPDGYMGWAPIRAAEIPNARACVEENFNVRANGRIGGRLVDSTGRGVARIQVNAVPDDVDLDREEYVDAVSAFSDDDGYFELRQLPPGRYIVGINFRGVPNDHLPRARTIYPGANEPPASIELVLGQAVDLGRWELPPPLAAVRLAGRITWRDGTPAAGVYVVLSDLGGSLAAGRFAGGTTSGADGLFAVDGREGRRYRFVARIGNGSPLPLLAAQVEARTGLGPITLVIQLDPPR